MLSDFLINQIEKSCDVIFCPWLTGIWLNANPEDALYMQHQFLVDPPTIHSSLSLCLYNTVNILMSAKTNEALTFQSPTKNENLFS